MRKTPQKNEAKKTEIRGIVRKGARNANTHSVTVVSGRHEGATANVIVTKPSTGYYYRSGKLRSETRKRSVVFEE